MQITKDTYEEYFLLYIDNELDAYGRADVEAFVEEHPELRGELELLKASVFMADENVVFDGKEELFREEKRRAMLLYLPWKKMSAAAAVLLLIGAAGWLYRNGGQAGSHTIEPPVVQGRPVEKPYQNTAPTAKQDVNGQKPLVASKTTKADHKNRTGGSAAQKEVRHRRLPDTGNRRSDPAESASPDVLAKTKTLPGTEPDLKAASVRTGIAMVSNTDRRVDIPVQAQRLSPNAVNEKKPVEIKYADGDDLSGDDKIYFANTSFSKKNGLRVVFRKASRIIEKVTNL